MYLYFLIFIYLYFHFTRKHKRLWIEDSHGQLGIRNILQKRLRLESGIWFKKFKETQKMFISNRPLTDIQSQQFLELQPDRNVATYWEDPAKESQRALLIFLTNSLNYYLYTFVGFECLLKICTKNSHIIHFYVLLSNISQTSNLALDQYISLIKRCLFLDNSLH